jgi:predicted  nucleic acid-binding Zn-ribbon protein
MSDQPLTLSVLAKFHRGVIVPDIERIAGDAISGSEKRRSDAIVRLRDALFSTRERLDSECVAIKSGIARVEERLEQLEGRFDKLEAEHRDLVVAVHHLDERLGRVEKRLDVLVAGEPRYALRSEVEDLKTRDEGLQVRIRAVEKRLKG